jgi:hypothetical protein
VEIWATPDGEAKIKALIAAEVPSAATGDLVIAGIHLAVKSAADETAVQ